ncbi:DUF4244 domain-containing protein [Streptomyces albus]|uniref:DUF4244 domain-containing protein n=1 Tax=Streptomyces albus TaxID=1888 RepID=A0A6C1C7D8_9ACTN|nr:MULTISPECIES: DUF4244 domain-containing protein [Streptomyces]KPC96649.1 membrane protein [Streptomyces sp. NRRL F-6602]MDI6411109.1 DUF4244 domain-containing protein [Streptomyces albus]QID37472.1 DUF4244 domain-containing protein [Streptomyces albus]TGG77700.1 DUF4244 domain-containing protein [Streptomyces albus]UVN55582.1 DUF4244 domain-containing protein [Streptomyces albus]
MSEKVRRLWKRALAARKPRGDRGMSTAEYAIGTLAAVALAAVLYKVVNSGPVGAQMQQLIERALRGSF